MNELVLIKSADLNGVVLDCYVKPEQTDKGNFWATRTQIGELLGYENPRKAIKDIHERHRERLDKFSTVVKLSYPVRGAQNDTPLTNQQDTTLYSFKGLLEICRYSNQPKADAIIDWLWEVADEIRRTGNYSVTRPKAKLPEKMQGAKTVFEAAGMTGNQLVLALDELYKTYTGQSALEGGKVTLKAPELKPKGRDEELWQHIVSTFAPNEWFTASALQRTLGRDALCPRQVRRYLAGFVARKMLCRRGNFKSSEYIRNR